MLNINLTGVVKLPSSFDPGRPTIIPAIKALRRVGGLGLKDAKDVVDALLAGDLTSYPLHGLPLDAVNMLAQGGFTYEVTESTTTVTVRGIPVKYLPTLAALVEFWGGGVKVIGE